MDFLKNLGFDPVELGAQIINFLIIFYLLKRFLYKPVMNMVKQREDKIAEGLKQAEEGRLALEKALEEEKRILTNAQDSSKKIIEDARSEASLVAGEIEEKAKQHSERLLIEARRQIEQDTTEAERRISEKTGLLAGEILTRSLKGIFTQDQQKIVTQKALKNIKRVD